MKSIFISIFFTFLVISVSSQSKFTISGTITEGSTGETMIGTTIWIKDLPGTGTICNEYGFYSLTIAKGNYTIMVSSVGYKTVEQPVNLTENKKFNFKLEFESKQINEVVITAQKKNDNITSKNIGIEKLEVKEVKKIPVLFGEQDLLKTIQLTPGVKSVGEGNGGLYVRGGDHSQNLIILDEATVYNASHLLGFFSTFNSDAIKDITLYKGTAPSEYGGRLSSVLDVKMNEGNNQDYRVGGGIGLISSRLNIEGPIVKDKGSFLITGRRTYADLLFNAIEGTENQLYFYDLNAKANYKLNDNNRIYLSGYFGRDVIGFSDRFGIDWGNITGTARWNHLWSDKLFSNTSLIYSDYDYKVQISGDVDEFSIASVIKNVTFKHEFQYFLNNKNTFSLGLNSTYHTITPGQVEFSESSSMTAVELDDKLALENAVFFSGIWKPNNKWNVEYGLRLSSFSLLGPGDYFNYNELGDVIDTASYSSGENVKTYINFEPRLNIAYVINDKNSLKASYTRNVQNLHLVSNSTSSTPTDLWIPSSNNVKPEISDQLSLGYFRNFMDDKLQFSTELYYKWMDNQLDLKNGAEIRSNELIEGELLFGKGRAYGLELLLKKKYGKLNGWIGYTYSRTEKKIDGINDNNWYPAKHDITHDLSIVGIYDINKKWSVSATWVYNTGNAVTFPSGKYDLNGNVEYYYTERNGYRMPDYHRLDIGFNYTKQKKKGREANWNFSLYNAYGRKNAYTIEFEEDPNDPAKTQAIMTYLFTFVPSISYNFKF